MVGLKVVVSFQGLVGTFLKATLKPESLERPGDGSSHIQEIQPLGAVDPFKSCCEVSWESSVSSESRAPPTCRQSRLTHTRCARGHLCSLRAGDSSALFVGHGLPMHLGRIVFRC